MTADFRRIVTGHDADGRSIVQEDGPPPRVVALGGEGGPVFHEIWSTLESPARIDRASGEPAEAGLNLLPPKSGTRIRIIDFPPEDERIRAVTPEVARASFALLGAAETAKFHGEGSPHPFMHRTETIDYGLVLDGEITLVLEGGETVARAGDVIVQRGTNHAWANRSGRACRMAFILIDGAFEPGLDEPVAGSDPD